MARRTIKMAEVAAAAGVSAMTVSRAIRQPESVSKATRGRVEKAIQRLGYVPDLVASGLKSRQTRVIGCVFPSLAVPVLSDIVDGLTMTLSEFGYRVLLATSGYSHRGEYDAVAGLLSHRPDGVVLTGVVHLDKTRRLLKRSRLPIVEVWDWTDAPIDALVGYSNTKALETLVGELGARGRRRIAFLGTLDEENTRAAARKAGYEAAARKLGQPSLVFRAAPTIEGGREAMRQARAASAAIDAVACVNDMMAIGAIYELEKLGLSAPRDVAVAGFADYEIARYCTPALTTVRVPRFEIGRRAALILRARLAGEPLDARMIDVGFEIIWRESA